MFWPIGAYFIKCLELKVVFIDFMARYSINSKKYIKKLIGLAELGKTSLIF